jgi:hypothetical protein
MITKEPQMEFSPDLFVWGNSCQWLFSYWHPSLHQDDTTLEECNSRVSKARVSTCTDSLQRNGDAVYDRKETHVELGVFVFAGKDMGIPNYQSRIRLQFAIRVVYLVPSRPSDQRSRTGIPGSTRGWQMCLDIVCRRSFPGHAVERALTSCMGCISEGMQFSNPLGRSSKKLLLRFYRSVKDVTQPLIRCRSRTRL